MPKLQSLMNNIASIETRLGGSEGLSKDEIRQIISDQLKASSSESAGVFAFRTEESLIKLLQKFGEQQNEARTQMLKFTRDLVSVLNENDKILHDRIEQMEKSVGTNTGGVAESVTKSEKGVRDAVMKVASESGKQAKKLEKLIDSLPKSFPEPKDIDLSLVEKMISELPNHIVQPKVMWKLDIERDVNDRIESVVAHPMDAS